jgi:hypothetical protein
MLLAMAPPMPLAGKLVVAAVMLMLVGLSICFRRRAPFSFWSFVLALTVALVGVVALELALPGGYDSLFHGRGILAAIVGALCAAAFLRTPSQHVAEARPVPTGKLFAAGLILGPLLGLALGLLVVLFGEISPLDRAGKIVTCMLAGLIAGLIGAGIVSAVMGIASRRPRSPRPDSSD